MNFVEFDKLSLCNQWKQFFPNSRQHNKKKTSNEKKIQLDCENLERKFVQWLFILYGEKDILNNLFLEA